MKVAIILSVFVLLVLAVEAVNYKRDYCNQQDYVGNPNAKNPAGRYPHLHCHKDYLSLARTKGATRNVLQGNCNKVKEILADRNRFYGRAGDPGAITSILERYLHDGCPTLLSYLLEIIE